MKEYLIEEKSDLIILDKEDGKIPEMMYNQPSKESYKFDSHGFSSPEMFNKFKKTVKELGNKCYINGSLVCGRNDVDFDFEGIELYVNGWVDILPGINIKNVKIIYWDPEKSICQPEKFDGQIIFSGGKLISSTKNEDSPNAYWVNDPEDVQKIDNVRIEFPVIKLHHPLNIQLNNSKLCCETLQISEWLNLGNIYYKKNPLYDDWQKYAKDEKILVEKLQETQPDIHFGDLKVLSTRKG